MGPHHHVIGRPKNLNKYSKNSPSGTMCVHGLTKIAGGNGKDCPRTLSCLRNNTTMTLQLVRTVQKKWQKYL